MLILWEILSWVNYNYTSQQMELFRTYITSLMR